MGGAKTAPIQAPMLKNLAANLLTCFHHEKQG
jgi:hypothetical protein